MSMEEAVKLLHMAIWNLSMCFDGTAVQEIGQGTSIVYIQAANTIRSLRFFVNDITMAEFLDEMCWATSECAFRAREFIWSVAATQFL